MIRNFKKSLDKYHENLYNRIVDINKGERVMLAIYTVVGSSIVGIILSFMLYYNGYKKLGVDMFRGILGADLMYAFLVLAIGLAPMSMG